MKHAKITHTYTLAVPEDDLDAFDAIMNAGVSMVEATLRGTIKNARGLRSEWELIEEEITLEGDPDADISFTRGASPRQYADDSGMSEEEIQRDSILSKKIIEADADAGINFVSDVMGQKPGAMHPWMQGLSIFPEDHPLRSYEDVLRQARDTEALEHLQALSPKMKELGPADPDDVVHRGDIEDGPTLP